MNQLKIKNLNYSYFNLFKKKKLILKDLNLSITNGLNVILAPNGAGKTTLLNLISSLKPIKNGEIFLNDISFKKNQISIREYISYLPQNFSIYSELTGREFLDIMINLKLNLNKHQKFILISDIISNLEMDSYIDNKFKTYSGGMKQKLGIAQLLIGNSPLLILDEPTVGLDPEQRNNIRELFPVISQNKIVIITTHIIEDIEAYCDNLIILQDGSIIFNGNLECLNNLFENKLYKSKVNKNYFDSIKKSIKIIKKIDSFDFIEVTYIKEDILIDNSEKIIPTLEDLYLAIQLVNKKVCD